MATSRTKKQRNRHRGKRFTCAWRKDGGKAAVAAFEERERVRNERMLKRAGQFRREDFAFRDPYAGASAVSRNSSISSAWGDGSRWHNPVPSSRLDSETQRLLDHVRRTPSRSAIKARTPSSVRVR